MEPVHPPQGSPVPPLPVERAGTPQGTLVPAGNYPLVPVGRELAPPSVLSASPTPMTLLVALKRRWLLALTLGLVCGAVGAVVIWQMSPITWRAQTHLHVAPVRPFLLFHTPDGGTDYGMYKRMQIGLVHDRLVLTKALRTKEVANLPLVQAQGLQAIDWLDKQLQVDFTREPNMTISLSGSDPEQLVQLVNAVSKAYLDEIEFREQDGHRKRLVKLDELYEKYEGLVGKKRAALKDAAEGVGSQRSPVLQERYKLYYKELGVLQADLISARSKIRELQISIAELQGRTDRTHLIGQALAAQGLAPQGTPLVVPQIVVTLGVASFDASSLGKPTLLATNLDPVALEKQIEQHPKVVELQMQASESQKELQTLKLKLHRPETDARYLSVQKSLQSARKALDTLRVELRSEMPRELEQKRGAEIAAARAGYEEKLRHMQALEKLVDKQVSEKLAEIEKFGRNVVGLEFLTDEMQLVQEVHKRVSGQKEQLLVEMGADSRVTPPQNAYAIQTRDRNGQIRTAGMAGVGLFGLVVLAVGLWEFRARRVSGVGEVVHGLGLRLMGVLPLVPARALGKARSEPNGRWQQTLTESVDAARTVLVHAARLESLRVVMVTSALPGEGKTLLSSHLAVSMARAGYRTLLVDADLRRPSIYRLFDLPFGPGLSEVLSGQAELPAVVRPGPLEGLSVMTAGQWSSSAVHAVGLQRLHDLLEGLKGEYDFIVVDSAPVLLAADTLLIGQHADGVVLSVLRDVSRLPTVYAACERLASLNIRILGTVVGGASPDGYGSGYSYPAAANAS
ncbi:MAG: polysaccharide biosynthesis tyrosine autokinase [Gemmataceae bacterium]|nr:polysaccharide biosynthesis tyrosine autokinase [Gemmataceae bacterium]